MPMASSARARTAVVYNPVKVDRDVLEPLISAAARRHDVDEVRWLPTTEEDAGTGMARSALDGGADLVMVAGGDGTVRQVSEVLRGSETTMALLPSGTGNVLAYNLDLQKADLAQAVEVAFAGQTRRIDVGRVETVLADGRRRQSSFMVACGIGVDAAAMQETRPEQKRRIGILAYVGGGIRAIAKSRRTAVRIRLDGGAPIPARVHTVLVANCGQFPLSIVLLPDAQIDDGRLDVVSATPRGFFGWLRLWFRVSFDNRIIHRQQSTRRGVSWKAWRSSAFEFYQGGEVSVTAQHRMPCEIDGDVVGEAVGMRCWIDPKSLRIRVPAE